MDQHALVSGKMTIELMHCATFISSGLADTTMINDSAFEIEDYHLVTLVSPHLALKVRHRDRTRGRTSSHKASGSSQLL